MSETREIYCCACGGDVKARLTDGRETYSHRKDLADLPFWKCDTCKNFVGCHHKMATNPTTPLGIIATQEIKNARKHIHALLDPMWQNGKLTRGKIYKILTGHLGWKYHTAQIKSIEEARKVYGILKSLERDVPHGT